MATAGLRSFSRLVAKVPYCSKNGLTKCTLGARSIFSNESTSIFSSSSRSFWHLSSKIQTSRPIGCCSVHTDGDREFAEFLKEEISEEQRNTVPDRTEVRGFKIENTNGAEFVLFKEAEGETIRIRSNINASMDDDSEASADPDAEPQMVCRPNLDVYITKNSINKTLLVRCEFPQPDMQEEQAQEPPQYADCIVINEIALLPKGEEVTAETFCVAGSVMDGDFYDRLLSLLEDRGIDGSFCEQVVNYATEFEHNSYITFLQDVKNFAESK